MAQKTVDIRGSSKGRLDEALKYIEQHTYPRYVCGQVYVNGDALQRAGYPVELLKKMGVLDGSNTAVGHTTDGREVMFYGVNWQKIEEIRNSW